MCVGGGGFAMFCTSLETTTADIFAVSLPSFIAVKRIAADLSSRMLSN